MKCPVCDNPSREVSLPSGVLPVMGEKKYKCSLCSHTWFKVRDSKASGFHENNVTWRYGNEEKRDLLHKQRIALCSKKMPWPPRSVLDLGCGDGRLLELIGAERSVGVDINNETGNESFEYIRQSITKFDTEERFDLVCSIHSMEHVVSAKELFKKMQRLSTKAILIEVPTRRKMVKFEGHIHGFNDPSFKRFLILHMGEFKTSGMLKNVQGSSSTWCGTKR